MKKVTVILSLFLLTFSLSFAGTDQYFVNDNEIDALFESATLVDFQQIENMDIPSPFTAANAEFTQGGDQPIIAFLLCWFFGSICIHRAYMGNPIHILWYTITCGGIFGIVTLVDWVMLLIGVINDDISQYVDNPSFFMWM